MLKSTVILLVFLCLPKFNQGLRTKCEEVDNFKKRRQCYEAGQSVTFLAGGYYFCCYNLTHEQLVSIGASAFWTRDVGFCGRGACEVCSKKQECVVFSDDDIFCCPKGYSKYQSKLEQDKQEKENKELGSDGGEEAELKEEIEAKKREDQNELRRKLGMKDSNKEIEVNVDDLLEDT